MMMVMMMMMMMIIIILCSALRHKSYLTLLYKEDSGFFLLWNFRARLYLAAASQPRVFARLLVCNE